MMTLDEAISVGEASPAAYVLSGADSDYLYKGSRRNLKKRLKDHRAGRVSRTKNRRSLTLVYHEYCPSFTQARQRENWLKSGVGRDYLKELPRDCEQQM